MEFSLDYLNRVLPRSDPPPEYVPEQLQSAIRDRLISDGQDAAELIDRSARWTYAIFSEIAQGVVEPSLTELPTRWATPLSNWPWLRLLNPAVGVLDPQYEERGFGLVIQIPPIARSQIIGMLAFPRLDAAFPVALRAVAEDLHSAPTLTNASSCCWAEDNAKPGRWGFVTCRHAVNGVSTGTTVSLQGGGTGRVERKAPASVDAAFIRTTSAPTTRVPVLPLTRWATAGQSVNVVVASGLAVKCSVVDVTNTLGVVADHNCPINIYIDQPCKPGDSGSLVALPSNSGLGIYRGSLVGATVAGTAGQTVGFAQHLEQAVILLNVTPHN